MLGTDNRPATSTPVTSAAPGSPADQLAKRPGYRMRPYRPWRAFAGGLMIITAVVASITIYSRVGDRTEVLALSRDVLAGQQLTASDLEVVSINTDEGVPIAAAGDRDLYVGQFAKWRLSAGNLLDPATVQGDVLVTPGRGKLSLVVPAGEIPDGLREQSRVALYAYLDSGSVRTLVAVADATVLAVPPDLRSLIGSADSSSETVPLTVEVDPAIAPVIRASNYVGLMLVGPDEQVDELRADLSSPGPFGSLGSPGSPASGSAPGEATQRPLYGSTTVPSEATTPAPDGEGADE